MLQFRLTPHADEGLPAIVSDVALLARRSFSEGWGEVGSAQRDGGTSALSLCRRARSVPLG